ncbi:MAG: glycosyltransferase [Burkholderiales bacterium]|nr:glycosyltransferase [Burkholderiales bacterium]
MKVVVIAQEFSSSGGAEKAACAQAELLEKAGHTVRLIGDFSSRFPGWSGLQVQGISLRGYADLKRLGVFPRIRMAAAGLFDPWLAFRVFRYLRSERPDLVHLHKVKRMSPALFVALRLARVRVVATLHDHYLSCLNSSRVFGDATPCTLERCSFDVALSKRCVGGSAALTGYSIVEFGIRRHLAGDTVAIKQFVFPSRYLLERTPIPKVLNASRVLANFAPDPFPESTANSAGSGDICQSGLGTVLYFGRLSEEKGVALLPEIARRLSGARLVIVGAGPMREWLIRAAADLPEGRLEIVGPEFGETLRRRVESADVVVLPSICFENAPLAAIEAMALARPIVAARIGGLPELIRTEESGLLHEAGNVDDAAACIGRLLADTGLRARLGAGARQAYETRYSPVSHLSGLMQIYQG